MGVGVVLIHGAAHTAACWQPTVAELAGSVPDLRVLAVDLPGLTGWDIWQWLVAALAVVLVVLGTRTGNAVRGGAGGG